MGDVVNLGRRRGPELDVLAGSRSREDRAVEFRDVYMTTYPRLVRTLWFVVHDHELAHWSRT